MKRTPTKQIAKKLGVTLRHAARLKSKKDPRVVGMEREREESRKKLAKETIATRKAAGADTVLPSGLGASATVQRLREHEHRLALELEACRRTGDIDGERRAESSWLEASEQLRKSENDVSKVEAANKNQIPVSDVEAAWTRGMLTFRKTMEALPRRVSTLQFIPTDIKVKLEQVLHDEVAKCLGALVTTKWEKI